MHQIELKYDENLKTGFKNMNIACLDVDTVDLDFKCTLAQLFTSRK